MLQTSRGADWIWAFSRIGMFLFVGVFIFMGTHAAGTEQADGSGMLDVVFEYDGVIEGGKDDESGKKPQYSIYIAAGQDLEGIISLQSNARADPNTWFVLSSSPSSVVFRKGVSSIFYYRRYLPENEYYRIEIKPCDSVSYYSDIFIKRGSDFAVVDWEQVQKNEKKYLHIGLTIILVVILMVVLIGLIIQQKFNAKA